jgi:hypothetical protein
MSPFGTSRTSGDVRLESAKRAKADIDQVAVADAANPTITSSARASSLSGTASPSNLAVADPIRASSPPGLREQAGHMTASDRCAAREVISCQAVRQLASRPPLAPSGQEITIEGRNTGRRSALGSLPCVGKTKMFRQIVLVAYVAWLSLCPCPYI